jgi:hypothetical protein
MPRSSEAVWCSRPRGGPMRDEREQWTSAQQSMSRRAAYRGTITARMREATARMNGQNICMNEANAAMREANAAMFDANARMYDATGRSTGTTSRRRGHLLSPIGAVDPSSGLDGRLADGATRRARRGLRAGIRQRASSADDTSTLEIGLTAMKTLAPYPRPRGYRMSSRTTAPASPWPSLCSLRAATPRRKPGRLGRSRIRRCPNTWITRANLPSTERLGLTSAVVPDAAGQSIFYVIGGSSGTFPQPPGPTTGALTKVHAYTSPPTRGPSGGRCPCRHTRRMVPV